MKFLYIIFLLSIVVEAQNKIVSNLIHIEKSGWEPNGEILSFIINATDSTGTNIWESPTLTKFNQEDDGFDLIVDIPNDIYNKTNQLWCSAITRKTLWVSGVFGIKTVADKIEVQKYGGVLLSKIKLNVKSNPVGAESYIIPNRIWQKSFKNSDWQNETALMKFKINTSKTDTSVIIDETVYVVVCKYGDIYKIALHNTKPFTVESEQSISFEF